MAPEFFPFLAIIGLALMAPVAFVVGVFLLRAAGRRKELRKLSVLVLCAVAAILLALVLLAAHVHQQFFLNEPFVTACGQGDVAEAKRLLSLGASPDAYGIDFHRTALIAASESGEGEIVTLLLSNGANVRLKDSLGKTALQHAEERGHRDIVLLLERVENVQQE